MREKIRQIVGVAAVAAAVLVVGLAIGCEREEFDPDQFDEVEDHQSGTPGASHHYDLEVDGTEVEPDQQQTVSVQVLPGSELWVNLDFPWAFEIDDADGLDIDTVEFDGDSMDLSEEKAVIPVSVTASGEGEYRVRGTGDFSVCNDEICHTLRNQDVEFVVDAR